MTDTELILTVLTFVVMLVGAAGVIVPLLPDLPLIWLAALGYGIVVGFEGWVGVAVLALHTVLALVGVILDVALGPAAARRGGASWQAIGASVALGLVGLLFFPPIGPLVGALLGLFLVEYQQRGQNVTEAWEAVKRYAVGCGWSVVLREVMAFIMIATWGAWVYAAST